MRLSRSGACRLLTYERTNAGQLEPHFMIETICLVLFLAAIVFVALGPKSSRKKDKDRDNLGK
jgi:hypothetical protein